MEGHTLVYMIFILAYLYFLARVIDRYNGLIKKKNRIKKPADQKKGSKEIWMNQIRDIQHKMKALFKKSILLIMIIPVVEVVVHLIIGQYYLNGQLLSMAFFLLFSGVLALTLYIMNVRSRIAFERKFDWDLLEQNFNSDSKLP